MAGLKEKVAVTAAAMVLLMTTLPSDEGVRYTPYKDVGGLLTVCYGHTGPDVKPGVKYTEAECLNLLKQDTKRHMDRVQSCMKRTPTGDQLAAFTSMDFNTGAWCGSRSSREFNLGNDVESCEALAYSPSRQAAWSYVRGVYFESLFNRRLRERKQCLNGLY